jgi:hypothetical protein
MLILGFETSSKRKKRKRGNKELSVRSMQITNANAQMPKSPEN